MPIGELATFDEGDFQGTIDYSSSLKSIKLGMDNKEISYNFFAEKEPYKSYMIIGTETPNLLTKWRLWINNFSLTKEFRPNINLEYNSKYFNIHVFDISHFVKKGKNEFVINSVTVEPITVNFINSLIFYNISNFYTKFSTKAGILMLKSSERLMLKNFHKSYIILKNPNKSVLKIYGDGTLLSEIGDNKNSEEIEINENKEIDIIHEGQVKCPAFIYLHYTAKTESPKIDISVDGKVIDKGILLNIENCGEIDLDKLLVNIMLNGVTVHFKTFENVKTKSIIRYEIPMSSLLQKKGNLNIRVVGVKAGLRKVIDKEIER
ncbi:hypothetical protein [Acidianus brierleyi]|uniref:Uncharacterized protein n=1 Tax=Acidianus brierleyi TaxID=41673 RepID=A0A2U9IFU2_9CREN|nr:hypothetical protein [Acidianus brierleyi]AWR94804.1 hypothetical protein DFR85_09515 [Acidianus brierleyi]